METTQTGETGTAKRRRGGRTKNGRTNGSGTLEKHRGIWLARWTLNGKRFTRSTGEKVSGGKKAREAALKKLATFTACNALKDERRILEMQVARLAGVDKEIAAIDEENPALRFMEAWGAYMQSQSRPRSGAATLQNYEQQYFTFVDWVKNYHADITELRQVSREIAEEYAQFLLSGTPKAERDKITEARKWLYRFDYRRKKEATPRELTQIEQQAIQTRREIAARNIREAVRGGTFNKHINALALIWRHVARHEKAHIKLNPWSWDADTGEGIRRIILNHAERPHTRRALTTQEVYTLLQKATGELRALIAIGYYTGLRLGDACLLDWGNFDRVTGYLKVRSRKTDTETNTPIHPALANILQAETKKRRGYVLPKYAQLYLSGKSGRVSISSEITELLESIGIVTKHTEEGRRARNDCGFHSLRHTFVTALRGHGATLHTAKELAGHNTERMTEHYTHEDGRAIFALPDMTAKDTARQLPEIVPDAADLPARSSGPLPVAADRPAVAESRKIGIDDFRAAIAGMTASERAEMLREICGAVAADKQALATN